MPEVMLPRLTGKAQYATRVAFPEHAVLQDPGQPASSREREVDRHFQGREDARGGVHIDVARMDQSRIRSPTTLHFQGEVVAIVAAETEDQAEDAIAALEVEYEVLPFASSLQQAMAPNPPDLSSRGERELSSGRPSTGATWRRPSRSRMSSRNSAIFGGGDPRSDSSRSAA